MFIHNFKYSLRILFGNKMLIFWTLAFPILMATFFCMAFSDIEKNEKLDIIDIAVVDDDNFNNNIVFKNAFKTLSSKKNKDRLFSIKYTNMKNAKKLLSNGSITGYLVFDNGVNIYVSKSGINESVLKYVVDEILEEDKIINDYVSSTVNKQIQDKNIDINYEKIYSQVKSLINSSSVKLNNVTSNNMSYTMIEYYTLIAMTCLYGGIISMFITNYYLANMNSVGKRISVSKISKGKLLSSGLLAGYLVQLLCILLLFIYTIFVLKVDYGNCLDKIILLSLVGSFAGSSLGIMIGVMFKSNENTKLGIMIGITMLFCFLSGMMGITMKYVVDKNIPILNMINPANMITDGLYSLYYYDTFDRFYFNLFSLVIFSIIMILLSLKELRRQTYDSI